LADEGFAREDIRLARALDMRYAGQGYELTIPCGALRGAEELSEVRRLFDETHKVQFGHSAPEEVVEIVSWRLQSTGIVSPVETKRFEPAGVPLESALRGRRPVRFAGRDHDCPIYQRERLDVGHLVAGPAVIEQYDCTIVLEPGQVAQVDEMKNLVVRR
jgi:N-methylhydantoinase A